MNITRRDKEKLYFWYSEKQKHVIVHDQWDHVTKCLLDDGRIVEYTEANPNKYYPSAWDDAVSLGRGTIYEIDGVRQ